MECPELATQPTRASVDPDGFKRAMRRLAGAVTIITTCHEGKRRGLTATAVCSLSVQPPSLLVCVSRSAEAHDVMLGSRCLCVNLLAGRHESLAGTFAARDGTKGEERFARGDWGRLLTGAPYLRDGLAAFDCEILSAHTLATHSILVCGVVAVHSIVSDDPLLYFDGYFAGLGPHSGHRLAQEVGEWI